MHTPRKWPLALAISSTLTLTACLGGGGGGGGDSAGGAATTRYSLTVGTPATTTALPTTAQERIAQALLDFLITPALADTFDDLDPATFRVITINADGSLVELGEDELARLRGERIGFVFQFFHLLPSLTALENVLLPLELSGVDHEVERASEALEQVGLESRLHHSPHQLSGGEKQRVAIARAFVTEPALLFADEPTGNLDPELAFEIMSLFQEINARGTTVLVATHDRDLITRLGKRVILLEKGRVAES